MSDLEKAAQDAVNAAANSEQLALIAAVLKAQQLTQQPVTPPTPVAAPSGGAAKWIGIGIGGSALLLAVAVSAVAIAISAVALTVCVLALRSVWQDVRKNG
ncbi:hypothetical protein [Streptomyces brevispora]|uniref:Uncharacterized protein n=1 Tax=Streptomyces brevispora TaxID=887462 RepID=A0ABZ1G3H0_9ACTN|nr:hypothetical protein [Streptomyces brevispora]WSC14342.1 hypothetical protein OIE64_16830 [Streptomyces brevispora]